VVVLKLSRGCFAVIVSLFWAVYVVVFVIVVVVVVVVVDVPNVTVNMILALHT